MACTVTITGTGNSSSCYTTVNGTKYYQATSAFTLTSNVITFTLMSKSYIGGSGGSITVDGVALTATGSSYIQTATWTVPEDTATITINLSRTDYSITVTTTTIAKDNRTLINGTGYKVYNGKALINGTGYEIVGGKTLVNGTAYAIKIIPSATKVTITGTGNSSYCYVTINGTKYYQATTLSVTPGFTFEARAGTATSRYNQYCTVVFDGTTYTGSSGIPASTSTKMNDSKITVNITLSYSNTTTGSKITVTTS